MQLPSKTVIAAIIIGLVFIGAGLLLMRAPPIRNIGRIKTVGVGVYSDLSATMQLREIDWGMLEPGESKNFTAYVRNEGNVPGTLSMNSSAWQPQGADAWISLIWTAEGAGLDPVQVIAATWTLSVSPLISNITDFSFDINVWIHG